MTLSATTLSPGQERVWLLNELHPRDEIFTLGELMLVTGELSARTVRGALSELAARHPLLRTVFRTQHARPQPVVLPAPDVSLDVVREEATTAPEDRMRRIRQWAKELTARPFDKELGPLWRAGLLSLGPGEHALLLCAHQLVADRRSLAVLFEELGEICTASAQDSRRTAPPSAEYHTGPPMAPQTRLDARVEALAGMPVGIELPADRIRPRALGFTGAQTSLRLPADTAGELAEFARAQETDTETLLLTAFAVLAHRYTGVTDIVLGTPHRDAGRAVGPLTNLLVVRAVLAGDPPFSEALERMRHACTEARAYADVPFEQLVEKLDPERDLSRRPVCQLGFEIRPEPTCTLPGATTAPLPFDPGTAAFDLALVVTPEDDGTRLTFTYDTELFEEGTVTRLAENFSTLLAGLAAKPGETIGRQRLLAPEEARHVLYDGNDTRVDFPTDRLIHQLVAEQAARRPEAIALVAGDDRMTFGELDRRANQVANHLRELGVGPQVPVGICLRRSIDLVVGVLGILKAAGAAVLLDPSQPTRRLASMLNDARTSVLLTSEALLAHLPSEYAGHVRCLDRDRALFAGADPASPPERAHRQGLCQIAYTSGSTGEPRGVAFHHGAVLLVAHGTRRAYSLTEEDRGTWISAPGFGISYVNELWPFLSAGAAVHIADETTTGTPFRIRDWLIEAGITVTVLAKALAERVCAVDWPGEVALRILMVSGERVGWLPSSVPFEIVTIYGSTETTNATTCLNEADGVRITPKSVPPERRHSSSTPVGLPVPNARVYLLDASLQPVPMGVAGQIHVGGDLIQSGYLHRPDRTAEKWIPDPFAVRPGARMVATGDIGRRLPDGSVVVLGRADEQVSLNGYRIELGEVTARLLEHPAVRQATVTIRQDRPGERRMVAYLVTDTHRRPASGELRDLLGEQLPAYMVPGTFVVLDALPLLPNGKVNRRALPAPDAPRGATGTTVAPRTDVEETLARVWCEVLHQERVGVRDNYFELGGDSLTGMELMASVSRVLGVDLPLRVLFESPTIEEMAAVVEGAGEGAPGVASAPGDLPPVTARPDQRYEPFPLTDIQHAYWIGRSGGIELGDVGCHGYQEWDVPGLDTERLRRAVDLLVARHDMLRAVVTPAGQQRVLKEVAPYDLRVTDLRSLTAGERDERLTAIREKLSHELLAVDRWPLFDLRVTLVDETVARVHVSFDLLIFDARSARIFTQELTGLYENPDLALPALELSFRDYVLAERAAQESSPLHRASRTYWQERLDDLPPAPELPYLRSLGSVRQPRFVRCPGRLEPDVWQGLRQAGASAGITPSALLLAAFAEVLGGWSASPRFTINLTLFNRPPLHPQLNDLLGDFTSGLLHAVEGDGATFLDRARQVQDRLWSDLENRHTSSVQVMRDLARRQGGGLPRAAMPVVFSSLVGVPRMEWGSLGTYAYGVTQTPQVALDHQVMEVDGGLDYCWDAVAELFPDGLLDDMAAAYGHLLRDLATRQDAWTQEQPTAPPAGQLARRSEINATGTTPSTDPPVSGLLHEPFLRRAAETPDAPAVEASGRTLTYRDLDTISAGIAHRLGELGARPGRLVAVVMNKGWEQVAAVLGVLRAGAAYLPIDPGLPAARIGYLLENAQVEVVLTQDAVDRELTWPPGTTAVHVGGTPLPSPAGQPRSAPAGPEDLAYVIYTSGSTGEPKGVMIEHRAARNTVLDINSRFRVGPGDRVLAISSLSFDLSVWDVFGTLGAGGTLVIPEPSGNPDPSAWAELLRRHRVTVWNSVPALLQILLDYTRGRGERLPTELRTVLLSGDWIPVATYEHLREVAPDARLISLGGATEASIWSISYEAGPPGPAWASVPYGRPLANQRWHVLDDRMRPRPDWATGGLYIAGDGLARGYWRDPEKTAARFVTDPHTGERLYRTGDLGRWRPSGDIEILGREDFQVKILGHRVELGEIEAALQDHPQVAGCCVVALGEPGAPRRLVAHVVREPDTAPAPDELREFLAQRILGDIVPSLFNFLKALPLTSNGKVDRTALTALGEPVEPGVRAESPATETEEVLLRIEADILGADRLGPGDDFFTSGGDSLRAIAVINGAADAGLDIPVELFFQYRTVRELAARLDAAAPKDGPTILDMRDDT
ncbi:non-ribosomal peptide synthetase [Streptomyces sp. NBC_01217]|uniref:non-ribosomal peptide synthetase n=1 Tax=Streptomyces sp. NBC_01217 TaxID=2903779 RepID=UPI002E142880|nr:non-ribosomal peptide synthetase [Streptomyces sp. NBC_01217]WSQ56257.1 amino acid adenylation domain-containing protein [Streptomyces sp. NBC_01217]